MKAQNRANNARFTRKSKHSRSPKTHNVFFLSTLEAVAHGSRRHAMTTRDEGRFGSATEGHGTGKRGVVGTSLGLG